MSVMTDPARTRQSINPLVGLVRDDPYTIERVMELRERDEDAHYELIDGALIVTPAPGFGHTKMAFWLEVLLEEHCPEHLLIASPPFDVVLDSNELVQPDLTVLDPKGGFSDARFSGVPLLAVECLSPSSVKIDTVNKRDLYRRAGVPSYWLLYPNFDNPAVRVLELDGDDYLEVAYATGNGAVTVTSPFPVRIVPADLMRRATPTT